MRFEPIAIPNNEAQFLETRKFQVDEICRIFRVPPHLVGDLEHATFSNIEHMSIDFAVHTIRPWLVRIEQSMNRALFTDQEKGRFYVQFNIDGLMRGDYTDDGSSSFYELIKARGYQEKMEEYAQELGLKTLTIQGELCAPGIQQNRLRLTKPEWYVFTIRENGKRVGLKRMLLICEALDMTPVPIEEVGMDLPSKYPTVEALLARADGDYPNGGKKEGIVVRPTTPVFCPLISASLSMKIVSNKYLLKNEG